MSRLSPRPAKQKKTIGPCVFDNTCWFIQNVSLTPYSRRQNDSLGIGAQRCHVLYLCEAVTVETCGSSSAHDVTCKTRVRLWWKIASRPAYTAGDSLYLANVDVLLSRHRDWEPRITRRVRRLGRKSCKGWPHNLTRKCFSRDPARDVEG